MKGNSKRKKEREKKAAPPQPAPPPSEAVEAARTVHASIDRIVDALPSNPEAEAAPDRTVAEKTQGTKRLLRVPIEATSTAPWLPATSELAPVEAYSPQHGEAYTTHVLPFDAALRAFSEALAPRIREAQKNDLSKYLKGTP